MIRTTVLGGFAALLIQTGAFAQAPAAAPTPTPGPAPERPAAPRPIPPQSFTSPEQGFAALVAALRSRDPSWGVNILGSAGARFIRSGDPVADVHARDRFLAAFDAKSAIARPSNDRAVLQVGEDGWPLPIP